LLLSALLSMNWLPDENVASNALAPAALPSFP